MKALVVYDSAYGNTAKVAEAMAQTLDANNGKAALVSDVSPQDLASADLLLVGSPTQGGRPTQNIQNFLQSLKPEVLANKQVAAFDTRFALNDHGFGLKMLMRAVGFAAPKIGALLKSKGAKLRADPEGFIVDDKEGPLKTGELERAAQWMHRVAGGLS